MDDFINTELDYIESHENQFNISVTLSHLESEGDTNSTNNSILPILASIGATSMVLGCSCAVGYYWYINGVDISKLPLPYNKYFERSKFNYNEVI